MAITIIIARNNSVPEKLDKDIDELATMSGTLKEPTSYIDPVIIMEAAHGDMLYANYLRIPQFGRRYFIRNIVVLRTGLYQISAHVDVLSTYKDEIRDNTAIIHRSASDYELNFDDGSIKVFNNPKTQTKSFPAGFTTSQEFVLAVAGGSSS